MQPNNDLNTNNQTPNQQEYRDFFQSNQSYQAPAAPPKRFNKLLIIIVAIIIMSLSALVALTFISKNKANNLLKEDKKAVQKIADTACLKVADQLKLSGIKGGYFYSDYYTDTASLSKPDIIKFKQSGSIITYTAGCLDTKGPIGTTYNFLLVKTDGVWKGQGFYATNSGTGFVCSVLDKQNVTKAMVSKCADSAGANQHDR